MEQVPLLHSQGQVTTGKSTKYSNPCFCIQIESLKNLRK